MKHTIILLLLSALPSLVLAQERDTYTVPLGSTSDADRTIGRARIVTKVVEAVVPELSLSRLAPSSRKRVLDAVSGQLEDVKVQEGREGGESSLRARIQPDRTLEAILAALRLGKQFHLDWFRIEEPARAGFLSKPGLDDPGREAVRRALAEGCRSFLTRRGLREADRDQRPTLLIAIKANITLVPFNRGTPQAVGYRGYLRQRQGSVRLVDKVTPARLLRVGLKSDRRYRNAKDLRGRPLLHSPWVSKADVLTNEVEDYAEAIGRKAGSLVFTKLLERLYTNKAWF